MTLKKKMLEIGISQYINLNNFKVQMIKKTTNEVVENTKSFTKSNVNLAISVARHIFFKED